MINLCFRICLLMHKSPIIPFLSEQQPLEVLCSSTHALFCVQLTQTEVISSLPAVRLLLAL